LATGGGGTTGAPVARRPPLAVNAVMMASVMAPEMAKEVKISATVRAGREPRFHDD
jgi:hypothetical protein